MNRSSHFSVTVLSAEDTLYSGSAVSVTIPTNGGEITVLPHHAPLVSTLHAGELTVRHTHGEERIFVGGGVVEFTPGNECRVLADVAERSDAIDEAAATTARERAEKALAEAHGEADVAAAQIALLNAIMRLKIVERRKHYK